MHSGAFTRRIAFIKPAPETLGPDGEMVPNGEPVRYEAWAYWKEVIGSESYSEDQQFERDTVEVTTWWSPPLADMDNTWDLESETGETLDIESVVEAVTGQRNWQVMVRATRRK